MRIKLEAFIALAKIILIHLTSWQFPKLINFYDFRLLLATTNTNRSVLLNLL
jgi:hypothetical protein